MLSSQLSVNKKNKILQSLTRSKDLLNPALVCCPHAGGSANFFRPWASSIPDGMDLLVVQYSGREDRIEEPCVYSMDELIAEILPSIQALRIPYVLFGHSMGAAVAFELCTRLEKSGVPPVALMLSSHPPLDEVVPSKIHLYEEHELWQEIARIGGTSSSIIEKTELRSLLTPPLRADYQLIETYQPGKNQCLSTPVVVCLGDDDPDVPLERIEGWQRFCLKPIKKIVRNGGHFYLNDYRKDLIAFAAAVLGVSIQMKKNNTESGSIVIKEIQLSVDVEEAKELKELPVSVGQRMMWLMDHYQGKFGALNCPIILKLDGELDIFRLMSACQEITERHETVRTRFVGHGQTLKRIVKEQEKWNIQVEHVDEEISKSEDPVSHSLFQTLLRDELRTRVDIKKQCIRIRLWQLDSNLHILCMTQHHLITDAWSCGLLSRELGLSYNKQSLPELKWQYRDFVEWETQQLNGENYQRHHEYWSAMLKNITVLALPKKKKDVSNTELEEDTISFYRGFISARIVTELEGIARGNGISLFTLMLSLFFIHLHHLTGQNDLSVSTLLANRPHESSNQTQGFFANMVILRCIVQTGDGLVEILNTVRDILSGSLAHQVFPYQLLPSGIVPADIARDVVFQMFADETHQTEMDGLIVNSVEPPDGLARRFDLDLAIIPSENGMKLIMAAADKRFKSYWSKRFLQGFIQLVEDLPLQTNNLVIT